MGSRNGRARESLCIVGMSYDQVFNYFPNIHHSAILPSPMITLLDILHFSAFSVIQSISLENEGSVSSAHEVLGFTVKVYNNFTTYFPGMLLVTTHSLTTSCVPTDTNISL